MKFFITLVLSLFLLVGCVSEDKPKTIPEQLSEIQDDFSEVLSEKNTQYGKMVFYSLENEAGVTGVGLAIFENEGDNWEYSDGTAHLLSTGDVGATDYININEEVKIVYGYVNKLPINDSKLVKSEDMEDDILFVTDSFISYTFVQPERQLKLMFE